MKKIKSITTAIAFYAALIYLASGLNAQIVESNNSVYKAPGSCGKYEVKFGSRPPVDLKNVSEDAFKEDKIRIQVQPYIKNRLDGISLKSDGNNYLQTGIPELDLLNKAYGISEYRPMLDDLYDVSPVSENYRERHEAWGFHLWYELSVSNNKDIKKAVSDFENLKEVQVSEPVYKIRLIEPVESTLLEANIDNTKWTPNDPYYANNQWHLNNTGQDIGQPGTPGWDINAEAAWDIEKGNANVVVAIIDSGVDFEHEDLSGNMWTGIGPEGTGTTPGSHGTHVAGTVSAVTNNNIGVAGIAGGSGVDDGVRIMSIDIFNGTLSDFNAFVYAADNGAAVSQNSWGYQNVGVYNQSALNGIDYFNANGGGGALLDGGITIFAAGNDNNDGEWYPAFYEGAMAVASHDNRGKKSGFSNFGDWIDVTAPGTNVASTELSSSSPPYSFKSGTSMACPHVSGVAALVISNNYSMLTNMQLWEVIANSAREDLYDENPSYEGLLGSGALDAFKALEIAKDVIGVPNHYPFFATANNTNSINLNWELNEYEHEALVVWNDYGEDIGKPLDYRTYEIGSTIPGGGTVIFAGDGVSYLHENLQPGTGYVYRIWARATNSSENFAAGQYSYGISEEGFTDCLPITDLPYIEDFNDNHHIINHCWSFIDHMENRQAWELGTIPNGLEVDTGSYVYVNSNRFGPDGSQDASLISPVFDFSEQSKITLEFKHYFRQWEDVSMATLSYTTDNGSNWHEIKAWDTSTPNPSIFRKVIEDVGGESNVQLKWHYTGEWGFYWCIDDVTVMETEDWHYADFDVSKRTVIVGETVEFEDRSEGGDFSTWEWVFGENANPTIATGKGPHSVVYSTPSFKNPSMTINDNYTIGKPDFVKVLEITNKLHWDDNNNEGSIGLGSAAKWQTAARFKKSDLVFYDDSVIVAINVFINHLPNAAEIKLWETDEENNLIEVLSQEFDPVENDWNEVALDMPYRISSNKELWIGVEYDDPGADVFPAGIDSLTNYDRKGNLLRTTLNDHNAWMPLSLYGLEGDWNIQAILLDDPNKFLISGKTDPPVAGTVIGTGLYDKNTTAGINIIPSADFEFVNWTEHGVVVHEQQEYSFTVDRHRDLVAHFKDVTIVENMKSVGLSIYPNPAKETLFLSADKSISEVVVYDMMGKIVYNSVVKSNDHTINVSDFFTGIYIVHVHTDNEVFVRKIQILN